jgi:hypothetical protein
VTKSNHNIYQSKASGKFAGGFSITSANLRGTLPSSNKGGQSFETVGKHKKGV